MATSTCYSLVNNNTHFFIVALFCTFSLLHLLTGHFFLSLCEISPPFSLHFTYILNKLVSIFLSISRLGCKKDVDHRNTSGSENIASWEIIILPMWTQTLQTSCHVVYWLTCQPPCHAASRFSVEKSTHLEYSQEWFKHRFSYSNTTFDTITLQGQ